MSESRLIDGLVATAEPVQRRRPRNEIIALIAVAATQLLGATLYFGWETVQTVNSTGGMAMTSKLVVFGLLAVGFSITSIWSLDPASRRTSTAMTILLAVAGLIGLLGFDHEMGDTLGTTLYPQHGIRCVFSIISLALPVTLLLALFMAKGASTQPGRTATMIGLAGGSWGAFTYALQCPFVSLWYLSVWYVGGIAVITAIAALSLPRLARW